jgi:hypothetical protein
VRTLLSIAVLGLVLALVLPGCSSASASSQLLGTWSLDIEAMKQMDEFKNAAEAEQKMMEMMYGNMKMEFTFTETEVSMAGEMMGQKQSDTKPYTIKSEQGNTLVISVKNDEGVDEDVTAIVGGDTLSLNRGNESYELKRK